MNKSPKKFSLFQTHLILEIRPTFRLISYWTRLHRDYIISLLGQFPDLSAVKVLRKLKQKHPALAVSDRTARR
ncbi:hypothetical protein, partial [Thiolapillus sp.]|uniref:hypothetical protein n=1 Tax=Thiolapillus sp. TaxID=2017437 RepID=UPI003AF58790